MTSNPVTLFLSVDRPSVSKQLDRLKKKIAEASELSGVALDEQTHDDFNNIIFTGSAFLKLF